MTVSISARERLFRQGRTASALGRAPGRPLRQPGGEMRTGHVQRRGDGVHGKPSLGSDSDRNLRFLYILRQVQASFRISTSRVFLPRSRCNSWICSCCARKADAGTTSSSAAVAVSAPCSASRRHVKSWFGDTPQRRATRLTVTPASRVCATISNFSRNRPPAAALRPGQDLNLRIRTSHSHDITPNPYFKGETLSGEFGGRFRMCVTTVAQAYFHIRQVRLDDTRLGGLEIHGSRTQRRLQDSIRLIQLLRFGFQKEV